MQVKPIVIGNTQVKNNIFLAPMAGYTDYAFRKVALEEGYGLAFTELVSAKGLVYGGGNTAELLYSGNDLSLTGAQIFGADAYYMRTACESKELQPFNIVDINMGCPVPKVYKDGEGSALLSDIKKAENLIKECVKSGKNITVKIRTGQKYGDDIATDYAIMAEQAGAKLITVHGRVREAYYSGETDYNAIYKAKQAVKIPVIANGGIFTKEDAENMLDRTGADGIMLARGAIANVFLVSELLNSNPTKTLKAFVLEHLDIMSKMYKGKRSALEFRKFLPYYLKGRVGLKDLKIKIQSSESVDEIKSIIEQSNL